MLTLHRRLLITLFGFIALTALAGGAELLAFARTGNRYVPLALLQGTSFATFLVPGVLLSGVGAIHVAAMLALWRHARLASDLALLASGAIAMWIVAEMAILQQLHPLHILYSLLSMICIGAAVQAAWRSQQPRLRWTITVTAAEAVGFLGPALVGVLAARFGLHDGERAIALSLAGLWEGACLGLGQARVLPLPLRRGRYVALTALGGSLVWTGVMGLMLLGQAGAPATVLIPASIALGAAMLLSIGGMQWLEIQRHLQGLARARGSRIWIGWTALAWLVALPMSFLPGPLVDEKTPFLSNLSLWVCGGLLMAYVLSLITWQGARRLLPDWR